MATVVTAHIHRRLAMESIDEAMQKQWQYEVDLAKRRARVASQVEPVSQPQYVVTHWRP